MGIAYTITSYIFVGIHALITGYVPPEWNLKHPKNLQEDPNDSPEGDVAEWDYSDSHKEGLEHMSTIHLIRDSLGSAMGVMFLTYMEDSSLAPILKFMHVYSLATPVWATGKVKAMIMLAMYTLTCVSHWQIYIDFDIKFIIFAWMMKFCVSVVFGVTNPEVVVEKPKDPSLYQLCLNVLIAHSFLSISPPYSEILTIQFVSWILVAECIRAIIGRRGFGIPMLLWFALAKYTSANIALVQIELLSTILVLRFHLNISTLQGLMELCKPLFLSALIYASKDNRMIGDALTIALNPNSRELANSYIRNSMAQVPKHGMLPSKNVFPSLKNRKGTGMYSIPPIPKDADLEGEPLRLPSKGAKTTSSEDTYHTDTESGE